MASDVVIIGAGLGGATAAAVLSRAGHDVVVMDRHAAYPADFRAEQLVGSQTDALRRLGLLEGIVGQTTPMLNATSACYGKVIDQTHSLHYGLHYADMVNAARSLAAGAKLIIGAPPKSRQARSSKRLCWQTERRCRRGLSCWPPARTMAACSPRLGSAGRC